MSPGVYISADASSFFFLLFFCMAPVLQRQSFTAPGDVSLTAGWALQLWEHSAPSLLSSLISKNDPLLLPRHFSCPPLLAAYWRCRGLPKRCISTRVPCKHARSHIERDDIGFSSPASDAAKIIDPAGYWSTFFPLCLLSTFSTVTVSRMLSPRELLEANCLPW